MEVVENLRNFYDSQAEKFHNTRKNYWKEFYRILNILEGYRKDEIRLLDLGCGDGRFLKFLKENSSKKILYEGVDISNNLIHIARSQHSYGEFFVDTMENFLGNQPQQKYDFVVMNASLQHIPSREERLFVLKHIYRVLDYYGALTLVNWSFSKRFLKKYTKPVLNSFLKWLFSLSFYDINDIFIPWYTDDGEVFYRYYHIFFLSEVRKLLKETGFVEEYSGFVDRTGELSLDRKNSRNTFVYASKKVSF